jgi:flagellar motor switch protein FliN/FliY
LFKSWKLVSRPFRFAAAHAPVSASLASSWNCFQVSLRRQVLKADLDNVAVELTVVLGSAQMPIYKLLRMGRGAIIELNATENDEVQILANNHPFAKGHVVVAGTRISVEITEMLMRPTVYTLETVADAA